MRHNSIISEPIFMFKVWVVGELFPLVTHANFMEIDTFLRSLEPITGSSKNL